MVGWWGDGLEMNLSYYRSAKECWLQENGRGKNSRLEVPSLRDLMPDDLRRRWCNNDRKKVHNKCNALESSPSHPPTTPPWSGEKLSSTKLVSGAKSVGDRRLLKNFRPNLGGLLQHSWHRPATWVDTDGVGVHRFLSLRSTGDNSYPSLLWPEILFFTGSSIQCVRLSGSVSESSFNWYTASTFY